MLAGCDKVRLDLLVELLEAPERVYSSEFLPHTVTFNFLHSANEVTCRSCKEESHFLKVCLRFFLLSGLQAAVAPDVTGIAQGPCTCWDPQRSRREPQQGLWPSCHSWTGTKQGSSWNCTVCVTVAGNPAEFPSETSRFSVLLSVCFPNSTHFNIIQSQCFCLTKQYRFSNLEKFCKKRRNLWRKMPATATLRKNYKKTKTLNLGAQVTLEVQKIASISSFSGICQAHRVFFIFLWNGKSVCWQLTKYPFFLKNCKFSVF